MHPTLNIQLAEAVATERREAARRHRLARGDAARKVRRTPTSAPSRPRVLRPEAERA
jgi:hypothetical protein